MNLLLVVGLTLLAGAAGFLGSRLGDALFGNSDETRMVYVAAAYVLCCTAIYLRFGWCTTRRVLGMSVANAGAIVLGVCLYYATQIWGQHHTYAGGWLLFLLGPGLSVGILGGLFAMISGLLLLLLPRLGIPKTSPLRGSSR